MTRISTRKQWDWETHCKNKQMPCVIIFKHKNGMADVRWDSGSYYPVPKVLNIFLAIHFLHKNPCFEPIFFI
jgi:hypothetical protein